MSTNQNHSTSQTHRSFTFGAHQLGVVLAVLALSLGAAASIAVAKMAPENPVCPALGPSAEILALKSGGHVLQVGLHLEIDTYPVPPVEFAAITIDDDTTHLPLLWSRMDFVCCCNPLLIAEATWLLPGDIAPGTPIHVDFGKIGSTTVYFPILWWTVN